MKSDRIYQRADQQWYFTVRGNQAKGPYADYDKAKKALDSHIRQCRRRIDGPEWLKRLAAPRPRPAA